MTTEFLSFKIIVTVVFLGTFAVNASGGFFSNNWRGWIYPNADDLTKSKFIGTFDSLEECRDAAHSELEEIQATEPGDYECGYKCKTTDFGDVCKETKK